MGHEEVVRPFSDVHRKGNTIIATMLHDPNVEGLDVALTMDGSASMEPEYGPRGVLAKLGGAGSDVALDTADIVLMSDDLSRLPFAVGLSRAAVRAVKQNPTIALGVSAVLVVASVFGWVAITEAVVLHEGSTILVVLNGLRLLVWNEPKR